ncbi:fluoride efflux transporter CrcB [Chloroflexi bacterium TSY]|nr:fluoride efflux transporter CrcB [Chloroflexi bacterium TSY]
MNLILVGVGGFAGAVTRYLVGSFAQHLLTVGHLPIGTMTVNVIGCFLIGVLSQLGENHNIFTPQARLLIFVGFLGSFTTFSTFGNETVSLLQETKHLSAFLHVSLHIIVGFGAVWLGQRLILFYSQS